MPLAIITTIACWVLLKRYKDTPKRESVDVMGLVLLIVWVGSLQVMLDQGKDLDWFSSDVIRVLTMTAVIGFLAFLIWETTHKNPIVDLRVFRHRGFAIGNLCLVLTFGGFFALNVLTPLWLQGYMGYTATWAGYAMAWSGSRRFSSLRLFPARSERCRTPARLFSSAWPALPRRPSSAALRRPT